MSIPHLYHEWILWVGANTGLTDPMLHIHAGLAILLLVRVVSKRSLGTFISFWFVLAAELANELMDYLVNGLLLADTLSDLGNTLFWPFVISLGVRLRPLATVPGRREPGSRSDGAPELVGDEA
jgi:hypothetical protein